MSLRIALAAAAAALAAGSAAAQTYPGQADFRTLYKELVEINTTLSSGSCTAAGEAMAARLKAAGYADSDIRILAPADRPKDGQLIATLQGSDPSLKPILLLAHVDVVEANRADWERDPFTLVEENGYFYARGASDDKAMAASLTDAMIRLKKEGFKPKRSLRLALTCGEETYATFNGVVWLLANHPETLDAEFALNEGGTGLVEGDKRIFLGVQAGEKVYQDYTLTITNPGGHSSQPVKDNAIARLSAALARINAYDFPLNLTEATRLHFEKMSPILGGQMGADMKAVLTANPSADVVARISKDKTYNSMMRTTCVPTQVDAGHAPNALPQRATANVNCRIIPGEGPQATLEVLQRVAADPGVKIEISGKPGPNIGAPPLNARFMQPVEKVAAEMWPSLPIVPAMSTGGTDSRFLIEAGIPSYGLSGNLSEATGSNAHGLNERIRVRSLYEGREFMYRVIKLYAQK